MDGCTRCALNQAVLFEYCTNFINNEGCNQIQENRLCHNIDFGGQNRKNQSTNVLSRIRVNNSHLLNMHKRGSSSLLYVFCSSLIGLINLAADPEHNKIKHYQR